jgi:hypothetical protein
MFDTFAEVPAYPLVFPIFWGAFALFLVVLARRLRVFTAVNAGGPVAGSDVGRRAWGVFRYAILQSKMFRWTHAGVFHYVVFLGSTLLLVGNINIVTGGLLQAVVSWPLDGALWTFAVGVQNLIAVGVLLVLVYLFKRRLVDRPTRLTLGRTGLLVLTMIALVVSTEFFAQTFEAARFGDIAGAIVANTLAVPLRRLGESITEGAFVALWWAHILVLATFLLYIPTNKHFHVYTSFVNVWFRKLAPRGELPKLDLEDETATFGLKTLQDLGWKDLLDGHAPSAGAARRPVRPSTRGSRSTPKR